MKPKSPRQIAKEIGVSPSYLSKVKNGKCRLTDKLSSNPDVKCLLNVKQLESSLDTREVIRYNDTSHIIRERMSPGGLRGLQIRRGALGVLSVGSTPIRSRQRLA